MPDKLGRFLILPLRLLGQGKLMHRLCYALYALVGVDVGCIILIFGPWIIIVLLIWAVITKL